MTNHTLSRRILPLALCAGLSVASLALAAPATAPAAAGTLVEYPALEHQVGAEVVVETTLGTVRRGTLVKYTNPTLTLQLAPSAGGFELSIPRETVRSLRVVQPAPAPADAAGGAAAQEGPRAETN